MTTAIYADICTILIFCDSIRPIIDEFGMKIQLEAIRPDEGSSFRLLLDSRMNDFYYWHHHPEWELNYIRGADGLNFISDEAF